MIQLKSLLNAGMKVSFVDRIKHFTDQRVQDWVLVHLSILRAPSGLGKLLEYQKFWS